MVVGAGQGGCRSSPTERLLDELDAAYGIERLVEPLDQANLR